VAWPKPSKSSARRKPKKLAQPVRESRAEDVPQAVGQSLHGPGARIPPGYADLLEDLKDRIRHAQIRAATAVSRELNRGRHNPSIGLILCKSHNRNVVEYALRDTNHPMGVATYRLLRKEMKRSLPSPAELKEALRGSVRISCRATGTLSNAGWKASDVATKQGHQEEADGPEPRTLELPRYTNSHEELSQTG